VTHLPRPERDSLCVAYAIGRPVGTAVTRNRVRRRLRAAMEELDRAGATPGPGDLVVSVRPEAAACDYRQLHAHLTSALGELADGPRS
jgi:ribonuclease P protein component